MREIKFRVWDKKESKWLTNPKVTFIHHEKSWGNEFYLEIEEDWESKDYDPTRYVFIKHTGVLDRNGQELIEKDIVSVDFKSKILGMMIGVIEYEDGQYVILGDSGSWPISGNSKQLEKLGNFYENPELLSHSNPS